MFKKILIANRGEIAVRIIRACKEMGIQTVAVHSDVDRECLHTKLADQTICIGPASASESYLNIPAIISAAEITGADAIHPGYGFLAENTHFAEVCEHCGIKFIGPPIQAIQKMGDKVEAKRLMEEYGVPVIPGSPGIVNADDPKLAKLAKKIGYPIIVKASAGGGGKGIRLVQREEELVEAIRLAQTEAKAAFGNGDVYLEKYLTSPRHVEIQVVADSHGNVVSFPERDCSIQRRHQKLIEESPSSAVDDKLRKKMGKAARKAARAVRYVTVGTVEFLVNGKDDFYFLEMNTRIQVEHPVTEMITGHDLIKEQILTANGEKLGYDKDDIRIQGHAIECRINTEDPERQFAPCPGTITQFIPPGGPGVRVDTHAYAGYTMPPYYDSLLAKLIVMSSDGRESAIKKMQRAIAEFVVTGIKTTIPFHKEVMKHETFLKGGACTDFIQKMNENNNEK